MANVVFAKRLVAASVFQLSFIQNNDNGPFVVHGTVCTVC